MYKALNFSHKSGKKKHKKNDRKRKRIREKKQVFER